MTDASVKSILHIESWAFMPYYKLNECNKARSKGRPGRNLCFFFFFLLFTKIDRGNLLRKKASLFNPPPIESIRHFKRCLPSLLASNVFPTLTICYKLQFSVIIPPPLIFFVLTPNSHHLPFPICWNIYELMQF